jgi:hypothetical protein
MTHRDHEKKQSVLPLEEACLWTMVPFRNMENVRGGGGEREVKEGMGVWGEANFESL